MIAHADRAAQARAHLEAEARELLYPLVPDLEITLPLLEARAKRTYMTLTEPRRRELALLAFEIHERGDGPQPKAAPGAPSVEEEAPVPEEEEPAHPADRTPTVREQVEAAAVSEEEGVVVERPKAERWAREDGVAVSRKAKRAPWRRTDTSDAEREEKPSEAPPKKKRTRKKRSDRPREARGRNVPTGTTEEERVRVREWVEGQLREDPRLTARELLQGARAEFGVALSDLSNFRVFYVNPARDRLGIVWAATATVPVEEIPEEDLIPTREITPKLRRQIRDRIAALLEEEPEMPGANIHRIIRNEFRVDFRDVNYFRRRWVNPFRPEGAEPAPYPRRVVVMDRAAEEERPQSGPPAPPPSAPPAPAAGLRMEPSTAEPGRWRVTFDCETDQATALRIVAALSAHLLEAESATPSTGS